MLKKFWQKKSSGRQNFWQREVGNVLRFRVVQVSNGAVAVANMNLIFLSFTGKFGKSRAGGRQNQIKFRKIIRLENTGEKRQKVAVFCAPFFGKFLQKARVHLPISQLGESAKIQQRTKNFCVWESVCQCQINVLHPAAIGHPVENKSNFERRFHLKNSQANLKKIGIPTGNRTPVTRMKIWRPNH